MTKVQCPTEILWLKCLQWNVAIEISQLKCRDLFRRPLAGEQLGNPKPWSAAHLSSPASDLFLFRFVLRALTFSTSPSAKIVLFRSSQTRGPFVSSVINDCWRSMDREKRWRPKIYIFIFWSAAAARVARFLLVQHTKKYLPNYHKLEQMTIKYSKWPQNIPNGYKIYRMATKYTEWSQNIPNGHKMALT
jgi:hypothetical protein